MRSSSRVKISACRLNGALSRGPITGEGRKRSSQNGVIHRLYSRQVVLPNESREDFEALVQQHIHALHPRNSVELALVCEMAAACSRRRRIWTTEKRMLGEIISQMPQLYDENIPESEHFGAQSLSWVAFDNEQTQPQTKTADHAYRQQTLYHNAIRRFVAARQEASRRAKKCILDLEPT
jgi:hypothetical protein